MGLVAIAEFPKATVCAVVVESAHNGPDAQKEVLAATWARKSKQASLCGNKDGEIQRKQGVEKVPRKRSRQSVPKKGK